MAFSRGKLIAVIGDEVTAIDFSKIEILRFIFKGYLCWISIRRYWRKESRKNALP